MSAYHDLTNISDTLKTVYGSGISNQFADEQLTYNQFPRSNRSPRGLGYKFAIRYARAQGIGARAESSPLPQPLAGKYDNATVLPRYIYGTLRLTGPMIEAAKSDPAAFVDGLADAVDDIYTALVNDMNRQAWGDGFGLIAYNSAVATPATGSAYDVVCDNSLGVMRAIEGMIVDFYNSAGAVDQNVVAQRIQSINPVTKTITMEALSTDFQALHPLVAARTYTVGTGTIPAASQMVRYGARDAAFATTDTPVEITGLDGIFDDGTLLASFEDITVASYPRWRAGILGNSGVDRELSLDLLLQAVDVMRVRAGKKPGVMRMGLGQRRKYFNQLAPDVRFSPGTFKGGYEELTFAAGDGSIRMVIDPLATPGRIFLHPDGAIEKFEMTPIGWGNLDQQIHQRAGYDEWDQFLRLYTNLGTEDRNSLVLVKDLVEPGLYS
jgi:hypothetical protein